MVEEKIRILNIEDDGISRQVFRDVLVINKLEDEVELTETSSAREGLSKLQSRRYDLVFIDVNMNNIGLIIPDGYEFPTGTYLAEMARKFTNAKIIASTTGPLSYMDGRDSFDHMMDKLDMVEEIPLLIQENG
jgi:CheY-like chemotaxis protein